MLRAAAVLLFALLLAPFACHGQTMPILMMSDLHFDPLQDPAKSTRLASAPESEWRAILSEAPSPTQAADFAAMQAKCGTKLGEDADYSLLTSSLQAAAREAHGARFVAVSGDLVVHQFECRWKLATGHDRGYEDFHEKTARFVIRQVEASFPGTPVYYALGNNDSSCGDYRMDLHDRYFARTSAAVLDGLVGASKPERAQAEADYLAAGYFSVALPGLGKTRLLVLDDIFLARKYKGCSGDKDSAASAVVLQWLGGQLERAKQHGETVWVLAHIPPGINVHSTVTKGGDLCNGEDAETYLADDAFGTLLARYPETIRLALFGHTHSDEIRLIGDVPAKIIGSVTAVNGNLPSFTVGQVDRRTAQLEDYTVYTASTLRGTGPWTREYIYRETNAADAFDAAALRKQIAAFRLDPDSNKPATQAYEKSFFPGSASPLALVWPQASCALGNVTAATFRSCVCKQ